MSMMDEGNTPEDLRTNAASPHRAPTPWDSFSDHIRNINTESTQFTMKPTTSRGSTTFTDIMKLINYDLNRERRRSDKTPNVKPSNPTPDEIAVAANENGGMAENELESIKDEDDNTDDKKQANINEFKPQDKTSQKGQLKSKELTAEARVRQDLYSRYLYSTQPWHQGLRLYDVYKKRIEEKQKKNRSPAARPFTCPSFREPAVSGRPHSTA